MRAVRRAVALAAGLVLAACGPLRGAITTETPGSTAPGTVATTLPRPVALTTAATAPTSTSIDDATTEVPSSAPPLTAAAGQSIVDALRLGEGGLGRARFGLAADAADAYVRSVLGTPDGDTDWGDPLTEFGRCPGSVARVERWGQLLVVFADRSPYGDGRRHLTGWRYGPEVNQDAYYPALLAMSNGLAPGATLADVESLYPDAVQVQPATAKAPASFRVGTSFGGSLSGTDPTAVVTALEAGAGCVP